MARPSLVQNSKRMPRFPWHSGMSHARVSSAGGGLRVLLGQSSEADPSLWESTDAHWIAELRRAPRGAHLYLAVWRDGVLLGTYDGRRGWHGAGPASRPRRRPSMARQLAFAS
jgi:hypothetical protein